MLKLIGKIMLIVGVASVTTQAIIITNDIHIKQVISIFALIIGFTFISLGSALLFLNSPIKTRKKTANISLAIAVFFFIAGITSQLLQMPGARLEIIISAFILSFFYGPIAFKNKYEKWKVYARSKRDAFFLSAFDFLGIGFLFMGLMFKNQKWPWADNMIIIGLVVLAIGTLAWNQKFKTEVVQRKETEDKLKETLTEIENQKQKVEAKQKEIIDSIKYAKRIQVSLLPTEKYIDKTLKRLND